MRYGRSWRGMPESDVDGAVWGGASGAGDFPASGGSMLRALVLGIRNPPSREVWYSPRNRRADQGLAAMWPGFTCSGLLASRGLSPRAGAFYRVVPSPLLSGRERVRPFFRKGRSVELQSKSGQSLTRYFPEVVEAVRSVRARAFVLDAEIVIPVDGRLSFDDLLQRIHPAESRIRKLAQERPAVLIVFDLLVDPSGRSQAARLHRSGPGRAQSVEHEAVGGVGAARAQARGRGRLRSLHGRTLPPRDPLPAL